MKKAVIGRIAQGAGDIVRVADHQRKALDVGFWSKLGAGDPAFVGKGRNGEQQKQQQQPAEGAVQ